MADPKSDKVSSIDALTAVERKNILDALSLNIASLMRASKAAKSPLIRDAYDKGVDELMALQNRFR